MATIAPQSMDTLAHSRLSRRLAQFIAVAAALLTAGAVGCGSKNQYVPPPPPRVYVSNPVLGMVTDQLDLTGSTRAKEAVSVRARISGYLQSIEFKDGGTVEAGQVLFKIEPEPFEAAFASAEAAVQKAQAQERFARAEVARTAPLVKRGALAEQELESKQADEAVAKADVAAAAAALTQAQLNLDYTSVTAPISGRIGRHLVDVGNLVTTQDTLLTTIESMKPIYAYFTVSESEMLLLRESGLKDATEADPMGAEIFLGLDTEKGFPHRGHLDFAELGVDRNTGTQLRRASFDNTNNELVPGLFVRLRLPIGGPKERLLIEERAIGADQQGEFVMIVGPKNIVQRRTVTLGARQDGMRVVTDGLTVDDSVIVVGLQRARPDAPVDPKPLAELTQAAATSSMKAAADAAATPDPAAASKTK